jgi:hypothetical protein
LSSRVCFKISFDPCSRLGLKDIGEASSKLLTFWRSIAGSPSTAIFSHVHLIRSDSFHILFQHMCDASPVRLSTSIQHFRRISRVFIRQNQIRFGIIVPRRKLPPFPFPKPRVSLLYLHQTVEPKSYRSYTHGGHADGLIASFEL